MKQYRFDDIVALQELVSDTWSDWSNEFEVTQEVIDRFADLTGDYQDIHTDVEKAAKGPFGTTIAHGFLILVLIPKMELSQTYQITGYNMILNYGSNRLRFTGIVPSGSRIRRRERVKNVTAKGSGTMMTVEEAIHVVGQERPAMIYEAIYVFS